LVSPACFILIRFIMARIKFSPLFSSIRGSIGSATFQRSQGGDTLRCKQAYSPHVTQSRQLSKQIASQVIAAWQGLTDAQRTLWNQYAKFSPISMKYDHSRQLSGYNHFCKYNFIRLQSGLDIFEDAVFLSPDSLDISPEIAISPEIWVAVGEGINTIAWALDGVNWNGLGTLVFSDRGRGVCYNGSIFVGVGQGTNTIAWSSDGKNWTGLGNSIFSSSGNGVCWNGSIFVAVGEGTNTIAWSSDGKNWHGLGTSTFDYYGNGVCYNGSIFVGVGQGTNTIAWSSDGKNWTGLGNSIFDSSGYGVCWNGSIFVAVGNETNTIAWSSDGKNWTGLGNSIFDDTGSGVCWNGSIFVAVGSETNTIAWSSDGKNWTGLGNSIFSDSGYDLTWNGYIFIAVGSGTNTIAWSSDGKNWIGHGTDIFTVAGLGVCSSVCPNLYPPVTLGSLIFSFDVDLQASSQFALLKLSAPQRVTASFRLNTCRVVLLNFSETDPFSISLAYTSLFGITLVAGDVLNCEITLFSTISGKVFPSTQYRLTL